MKNRLAIIGCGELGQQVLHYSEIEVKYDVVGFIDDYKSTDEQVLNKPILGKIEDIILLYKRGMFDSLFIALGYKHLNFKKKLYDRFKGIIPLGTIIAPYSYIDKTAQIGEGVIIYPGCVIDKNVVIDDNVLINTAALIAHDSKIGKHSFISGRTAVAGFSSIGECCFTGINSTIIDNLSIPDNSLIPAGSVVITSTICQVGKPVRINLINNQNEE